MCGGRGRSGSDPANRAGTGSPYRRRAPLSLQSGARNRPRRGQRATGTPEGRRQRGGPGEKMTGSSAPKLTKGHRYGGTMTEPLASLLTALDLTDTGARTDEDIFTGPSQWMPHGRVFGGQVLAQSLLAAARTVDELRAIHSMH